jgi:hypothetical protein
MSCIKQLPGTRSLSVVQSDAAASVPPIDRHNIKSQKFISAMVLRLTLEALGLFVCDVACVIADCLIAALSWLAAEFLKGCATYAEATYPMRSDECHSSPTQMPDRARPTPTRLRLVVVAGSARDDGPRPHDHRPPSQAAAPSHMTFRDRIAAEDVETLRSTRAPAARRKNRPR